MDQEEFTKNIELLDELIRDCEKVILQKKIRIGEFHKVRSELIKYIEKNGFTSEKQQAEE